MLKQYQLNKLIKNWSLAETLEVNAEVRLYDPSSPWECYLIALNPYDEDEIYCIEKAFSAEVIVKSLRDIFAMYNSEGQSPSIDHEFRPRKARIILEKLTGKL